MRDNYDIKVSTEQIMDKEQLTSNAICYINLRLSACNTWK